METEKKCVEIIRKMISFVNEKENNTITISDDYKSQNACTLTMGKYHTHVGRWDGTFEQMIEDMYNTLNESPNLSFCDDNY